MAETPYYMVMLENVLYLIASTIACGVIISAGILSIKQVLHTFTISSK